MQSQLSEVSSGNRNGVVVETTLLSDKGISVPINKYKFKENGYLGMNLKVLQNVPDNFALNILVMDTKTSTSKYVLFEYDSTQPFGTFVLHDQVDSMIVSGRFKPSHSCKTL